jgi:hypothetical protein
MKLGFLYSLSNSPKSLNLAVETALRPLRVKNQQFLFGWLVKVQPTGDVAAST